MDGELLKVVPGASRAASEAVAGHAVHVASAAGRLSGSAEMSGVAAMALHGVFDEYCASFSERLSSMSAGLAGAAGSYTVMEQTNCHTLASIAPGGGALVPEM
jgi:hypothetical protein